MTSCALTKRPPSRQGGLTLVELVIATALSLIITAAVTTLFADVLRTNREMSAMNSQIQNARFALQALKEDAFHGGFWSRFVPEFDNLSFPTAPSDTPQIVPDPCLDYASWSGTAGHIDALLGIPVQVYEDVPANCAGIVSDRVSGTDVLVIRHAETCVPGTANCDPDNPARLYFQPSSCDSEIGAGNAYVLDTANFTLTEADCATVAQKRRFVQNIYYVRDYSFTPGDGIPALMRSRFDVVGGVPAQSAPEMLVQGIENFRVLLGIDNLSDAGSAIDYSQPVIWADPANRDSPINRGDGVPEGNYVHCTSATPCTVSQLRNVVALKIHVLSRANETTPGYTDSKTYTLGDLTVGPFNDNFRRHVYSTTMELINVTARRETP